MTNELRVIEGGARPGAVLRTATIVGFKSFMNKTTIEFAPGITAIIGPNGSGKSVLGESIRWVLAETNPRHLRAKKSEELIFGGSETRRSLGMAEVILHVDNTSRRLPIDFTEVEIGRRIYRDGQSEYLINGARVRLRDMEELLAGANLADNPFTFIGQGLVDQVLALRPSERRLVIEEAAGVRRLHERREDALQRLKGAEAELVRVVDILREIGPRVEMLREQAAKWQEYETIRNELRRKAIRWYRSSFGETAKTRAELVAKLASTDAEVGRLEDRIDEIGSAGAVSDEELREAREEEEKRRIGLSDALAAESAVRERIAATGASIEAVAHERERSRHALATLPGELAQLRAKRSGHDEEALAAARRARESADAARVAEEEASRTRVALAEAQAQRVETLLRGQAAELREAVAAVERELKGELPAGVKWASEFGEGMATASTHAAVLNLRVRGVSVFLPDDTGALNVTLAPDRRTALAVARNGGIGVTKDGFVASGGVVHISGAGRALAELVERIHIDVPEGSADVAAAEAIERAAFDAHATATKSAEDARLEAATSEERRASLVRLRDTLDEQIAATEKRIADEDERARTLEEQERDARARLAAAQNELGVASAQAREAERSAEIARQRALAAEGSRRESEQRLARARERLAELRGERSKLAVEEERASGALRLLEEQVRAELGLADDEPLPDPESLEAQDEGPVDEKNVVRDLQRLRRKLISLEPVNPLAATELADIGQRHDFLTTQKDDLEKAIADLRALADELATTIAEQFSTTLQAVDHEFGIFFQRLFNGGEARLRTSADPEDVGIDIVARPPGKRIGSLTQLSGGERALTAVALLLAILRVRPAPFCVLDEVDAALDERNVGRFTEALRELTDRTQFIVITHNRGTIEAADTMYGVSMDEGGVSKVISMKLSEARRAAGA
ncbi:MAG: AAA family ATPase [Chloroflexota bacterium]|nr:AAA family ATPase [Chloroflexota bacterium]